MCIFINLENSSAISGLPDSRTRSDGACRHDAADTRQAALDRLAENVAAYERDQRVELTPSTALGAYLAWWTDVELVEQVADGRLTATTRKYYVGQVNNHIVGRLGAVALRDLSVATIRTWQTWLRANGRSANTRKAALGVLKTALMKVWKYELIPSNPARLVDPPRIARARRDETTVAQVRALLAATADNPRLGAMLQMACHVPQRPGELFGAEWDATSTSMRPRSMSARTWCASTASTCCTTPRPTNVAWCRSRASWCTSACRRSAATPASPDPRRTTRAANTHFMAAGVDPVVVRQLSGHKSERMTDLYTTPLDTRMRAAVEFCLNECNANESPAQRMSVGRCQP